MQAREPDEPFMLACKGDKWRAGDNLYTSKARYDLDPSRKEYVAYPGNSEFLWVRLNEHEIEFTGETPVFEHDGKQCRHVHLRVDDGNRSYTFGFADGNLHCITGYERHIIQHDDGTTSEVVGHDTFYIDYILDTADPALFSLDGYTEVSQLYRR